MIDFKGSIFLVIKIFPYCFMNIVHILFVSHSPANGLILALEDCCLRQIVKGKHPNKMQVSLPSLLFGLQKTCMRVVCHFFILESVPESMMQIIALFSHLVVASLLESIREEGGCAHHGD